MKKQTIATIVAASLAASAPAVSLADTKDFLIGGVVGALVHKGITDHQRAKQQQQQQVTTQRSSSGGAQVAPSLNGQYTRSERIQIQSAFRDLGYGIGTVDGVLGRNSRAVIRQFQASLGEPQTGQLTRAQYVTLMSQVPGTNHVFARRELNRNEVVMLQQGLQTLGYYHGRIDGSNGPGTRGAMNTFLAQNGMSPATTTPVQGLVMARNAAGLQSPPYLYQEANAQSATQQPFGAQPQMQAGFGTQQQQANPFGAPAGQGFAPQPQPQPNPLFGTPNAQQPVQAHGAPAQQQVPGQGGYASAPAAQPAFGAQQQPAAASATPLFGAPQPQVAPQGAAPANTQQQNLFAPAAPQQQTPQPAAPQGGQNSTLFAAGTNPAPTPQVTQQQAPQSGLDIFSGSAQPQVAQQPQPAANDGDLFSAPASLASTTASGN